jgi:hypothetical protein
MFSTDAMFEDHSSSHLEDQLSVAIGEVVESFIPSNPTVAEETNGTIRIRLSARMCFVSYHGFGFGGRTWLKVQLLFFSRAMSILTANSSCPTASSKASSFVFLKKPIMMLLFGKEGRKLTDDNRPGGTLDLLEAFFGGKS